jgi:mRNA-degrading endonuclease RelE of RelBE toxin-antitoxin system
MKYRIIIKKRAQKGISKMPVDVQKRMGLLIDDLKENGPIAHNWPNYSRLSATEYHCHLSRGWVACWRMKKETIEIEVTYAGSRENAPY